MVRPVLALGASARAAATPCSRCGRLVPHEYAWPDEAVQTLIAMWRAGAPRAEIARKLGISKHSVGAKVQRLKARGLLVGRENPVSRNRPGRRPKPLPVVKPAFNPRLYPTVPVFFRDPACCFPMSDPGPNFRYCEAPVVPGKPYCEAHCKLAYIPKSALRPPAEEDVAAASARVRRVFGG